jgi:lysophospholipase L1-like esterase
MQGLIEKYPAAAIVFMTPLHRLSEDEPSMGNGLPLKRYVEIVKEVAAHYSIPVLDLFSMGGIQPRVPVQQERYCPDGLHPNGEGHKLIASRLAGFLKAL